MSESLSLRPATLAEANAFVASHHRHHKPVVGHRFSIACECEGAICGVVIVGRAVARKLDALRTLELTRVCTDGTPHAASKLIAAATRAAFAMGATHVLSYVLESEEGVSYRAAGWNRVEDERGDPVPMGGEIGSLPHAMDKRRCLNHSASRSLTQCAKNTDGKRE